MPSEEATLEEKVEFERVALGLMEDLLKFCEDKQADAVVAAAALSTAASVILTLNGSTRAEMIQVFTGAVDWALDTQSRFVSHEA